MGKEIISAVRICRWKTIEEAFSGKGSHLRAGRWYGTNTEVVCASNSTALAVLEILNYVNGAGDLLTGFWAYDIALTVEMIKTPDLRPLGDRWREPFSNPETRAIGDICYLKRQAVALKVPSVVVATREPKTMKSIDLAINGTNFLIFPRHPLFRRIDIHGPYKLELDQRLINLIGAHDALVETLKKEK
jgi:RES domain-containing protein